MTPRIPGSRASALRAGAIAVAVGLLVPGGAYAAVTTTNASSQKAGQATAATDGSGIASLGSAYEAASASSSSTEEELVVEDVTEAHGSTEEETDQLPKGEKKVKTAGVDGLTRTISRVTTDADGNELSREVVSTVAVTAKVDEVVLVGTKEEAAQAASKDSAGSGDSGSAAAASAPQAVSGTDAASAQATARSMMGAYGWGDSEFSCLVSLWNRESGWNYQAQNASSGAYGIPQALPGSKMASEGTDWATNPATQIKWGLGYIQGRYGSPCSAWSHSESTGWY